MVKKSLIFDTALVKKMACNNLPPSHTIVANIASCEYNNCKMDYQSAKRMVFANGDFCSAVQLATHFNKPENQEEKIGFVGVLVSTVVMPFVMTAFQMFAPSLLGGIKEIAKTVSNEMLLPAIKNYVYNSNNPDLIKYFESGLKLFSLFKGNTQAMDAAVNTVGIDNVMTAAKKIENFEKVYDADKVEYIVTKEGYIVPRGQLITQPVPQVYSRPEIQQSVDQQQIQKPETVLLYK